MVSVSPVHHSETIFSVVISIHTTYCLLGSMVLLCHNKKVQALIPGLDVVSVWSFNVCIEVSFVLFMLYNFLLLFLFLLGSIIIIILKFSKNLRKLHLYILFDAHLTIIKL